MAISKPSWLRSWLDTLNWDILVWRVYVGDAVESAIDWAIYYLNNILDWAVTAYNWGVAAWNKAVEEAKELGKRIDWEVDKLLGKIDAWPSQLGDWWEGKKQWVLGRIEVAASSLEDLINDVKRGVASLTIAWESFKRDTLPKLLNFSWVAVFYGKGIATINDWWLPTKQKLEDSFNAITVNIISELNQVNQKLADWGGFFANPWQWLLDRFADWFLGPEK